MPCTTLVLTWFPESTDHVFSLYFSSLAPSTGLHTQKSHYATVESNLDLGSIPRFQSWLFIIETLGRSIYLSISELFYKLRINNVFSEKELYEDQIYQFICSVFTMFWVLIPDK